jgi:predicted amino acid dehydrogenase
LTPPVFLLGEHFFEGIQWLAPHSLHTMQSVHDVGLDMGVLGGSTSALNLISSSWLIRNVEK